MARLSLNRTLGPVSGAVLLLLPAAVQACSVCFGQADDATVGSIKIAMFMLLGFTGTVLSGVAAFMLRLRRLARQLNERQKQSPVEGGD